MIGRRGRSPDETATPRSLVGPASPPRAATSAAHDARDADLALLVAEHYDRLVRLARLICRDGADAADAVQVGLEQAWRRRASLRDEAAARAWLDRIVVREAVRVARSRRSWLSRILHLDAQVTWVEPHDPHTEPGIDRTRLQAAFATLPPEQRAVVALHLHAGYSMAETATIVGAPLETVRSRLRLARARLRPLLGEDER